MNDRTDDLVAEITINWLIRHADRISWINAAEFAEVRGKVFALFG